MQITIASLLNVYIKIFTKYIIFCTNFKSWILVCPMECKCNNGDATDGGVKVNNRGYCESYCHKNKGNYYCKASPANPQGVFVDCRGCSKTGINLIKIP